MSNLRSSMLSAMIGLAAVLLLIASQALGLVPASHRIDQCTESVVAAAAAFHARSGGGKLVFQEIARTYDVATLPHFGSAEAKHVLVE